MTSHKEIPNQPPVASEPTRNFVVLVGAILIGIAMAAVVMPDIFRRLPSDMARTRMLVDRLQPTTAGPTMCVFGNSQVMNGVDTRRMSRYLPESPEIWNLSSTGQDVFESFLYYQELPDSVEVVVQCVTATSLEEVLGISANMYNAFVMYGYRPNQQTMAVAEEFASPATQAILHKSDISQRFEARWGLRSATNLAVRMLLRDDLSLERAQSDLYAPRTYTRKVTGLQLEYLLREFDMAEERSGLQVTQQTTEFLAHLRDVCRAKGARFVLVVLPEHPLSPERQSDVFLETLDDYCRELRDRQQLTVLNCIALLDETRFIDARHADEVGARLLTDRVTIEVKAWTAADGASDD